MRHGVIMDSSFSPHRINWKWPVLATMLLVLAVLLRSWHTLSHAAFYVEDTLLFTQYYGMYKPLADVVQNHFNQPYITLLSNFYGWLYSHLDVRMQASFYKWTGFAWGTAAAVIFFYSGLIRNRAVLLVGPLLVGLTGLNHIYYYNTLIYIMYTAVAILLCLLFFPTPKTKIGTVLMGMAFILLPWAGPYSVLLVPVAVMMLVFSRKDRKKKWLLSLLLISTVAYFSTVTGNTAQLAQLKLWVIRNFFHVLLQKIVFFGLVDSISSWLWVPVCLSIALVLYVLRRDRDFLCHSLVLFAIIGGSLALFYLSIKFPLYLFASSCHRFLSLYFWIIFLLYSVDRLISRYSVKKTGVLFFVLLTLTLIVVDNINDPRKRKVPVIPETRDYLAAVYQFEQLDLKKRNQFVMLELENYQSPFFTPQARVGSREPDAVQLGREDFSESLRTPFLVNP
jgi:hypothetical protein